MKFSSFFHKPLTGLGFLFLLACNQETPRDPLSAFPIDEQLLSEVLTDTASLGKGEVTLHFSATLSVNEEKQADIFPPVSGQVQQVYVNNGDYVRKGQVLGTMRSPEVAIAEKEAEGAKAELRTAERQWQSTQALFASGLASAKEVEEAENEKILRQSVYQKNHELLKIYGSGKEGRFVFTSPINGFITGKNMYPQMQIRPDHETSLLSIADLSDVWAIINIYESDIANIRVGDEASIQLMAYPDQRFQGKISHIYHLLDPDNKVINARVVISNHGFRIKPGMLATVEINTRSDHRFPSIPADCLIFDRNQYHVLVIQSDRKKVEIRQVKVDRKTDGRAYIAEGLKGGELVVSSKQVFIYESLKP